MIPAVARRAATALAGESDVGASHIPPAMVKRTRLDSRGLVSDSRSDAVVVRDTARVFTRSPSKKRARAERPVRRAKAARRDRRSNKPRRYWRAAPPRARSG